MLKRLREQFLDVRRGEWPVALALALFFFLVIAVFWVLKPLKRGLLLSFYGGDAFMLFGQALGGAEAEQIGKVLNMVLAYGAVVLFTLLVRRFERQQVVYLFCALLAGVVALFAWSVAQPGLFDVWSFYVFGDIFNTIMVATFWAFTNDVIRPEQAKRLYGPIGLGGVVGGFVGATFVSAYVEEIGRRPLLLACLGALAAIAAIAWFVNRRSPQPAQGGAADEPSVSAAVEGARLVFRSKYLLAILGLIGFYEVVSNIVDYQLAKTIEEAVAGGLDYDAAFGFVGQLTGIVSILVQLFVTAFVMNRFGVGVALLFLPAAIFLGSAGFLVVPVLGVAVFMSVADNSLNYSINQSAKESLYTPTSRDAKYKAKAFIDMFVQRFAKVVAVGLNLFFAVAVGVGGVRWLSVVSLVVLVGWLAVVRFAGRRFEEKATEPEDAAPAAA